MRFERRDFNDWWVSRPLWVHRLPYLLILGLVLGAGLVALPLANELAVPAVKEVPSVPPGGELAAPAPVPLPVFEGEMTFIAPVQTVAPRPTDAELRQYERDIFHEVNKRREEAGLKPLIWSDAVAEVARKHSEEMATRHYYSHTSPEGLGLAQRFPEQRAAENLLQKFSPFDATVDVNGWINSPGHRANILSPWSHRTGVGVAVGSTEIYITQNFLP